MGWAASLSMWAASGSWPISLLLEDAGEPESRACCFLALEELAVCVPVLSGTFCETVQRNCRLSSLLGILLPILLRPECVASLRGQSPESFVGAQAVSHVLQP